MKLRPSRGFGRRRWLRERRGAPGPSGPGGSPAPGGSCAPRRRGPVPRDAGRSRATLVERHELVARVGAREAGQRRRRPLLPGRAAGALGEGEAGRHRPGAVAEQLQHGSELDVAPGVAGPRGQGAQAPGLADGRQAGDVARRRPVEHEGEGRQRPGRCRGVGPITGAAGWASSRAPSPTGESSAFASRIAPPAARTQTAATTARRRSGSREARLRRASVTSDDVTPPSASRVPVRGGASSAVTAGVRSCGRVRVPTLMV